MRGADGVADTYDRVSELGWEMSRQVVEVASVV